MLNGGDDVKKVLSKPTVRGYLNDEIIPNLFLSNHDGYRVADHISGDYFYEKLMLRHAILAAYSGPVTIYYGDEFGDTSKDKPGAQKDNYARTSGHIVARNADEQRLKDYISAVMKLRAENPALWRGTAEFYEPHIVGADVLVVRKSDPMSDNEVVVVFSDKDIALSLTPGSEPLQVKALVPEFVKIK